MADYIKMLPIYKDIHTFLFKLSIVTTCREEKIDKETEINRVRKSGTNLLHFSRNTLVSLVDILVEAYNNKTLLPDQAKALFCYTAFFKHTPVKFKVDPDVNVIMPWAGTVIPQNHKDMVDEYKDMDFTSILYKDSFLQGLQVIELHFKTWSEVEEELAKIDPKLLEQWIKDLEDYSEYDKLVED